MEDFVTFEIAKKLKEKGFNLNCESFYVLKDFTAECVDDCGDLYEADFTKGELCLNYPIRYMRYKDSYLSAPTIYQVLKWLRTKKDIDIVIYPVDANTVFMGGEKYILSIYVDRKRYMKIHFNGNDKFVKWEDAALAGIKYVLDNLI